MSDRTSDTSRVRVRRGIDFSDELRICREIDVLACMCIGWFSQMQLDGYNHEREIMVTVERIRYHLNKIEEVTNRSYYDDEGVIIC